MGWVAVNGGDFTGFSPDELGAYQKKALGDDRYKILDLLEAWMGTIKGRAKSKERYFAAVKSFFLHNRAELPRDPSFRISAEVPPVVGSLTSEEIRKVVVKSNSLYRAAFLCMVSGGMGCSELVTWSNTGLMELRRQLGANIRPIMVALPGRKRLRNKRSYYTLLGRDAADALVAYMKQRPIGGDSIFLNQKLRPITEKTLAQYWTRTLKKLNIIEEKKTKSVRYSKNTHELSDTFRTRWHKSGADSVVAEFFMGHTVDPLGYNKAMEDIDYTRKEFRKAEKWLNILSEDPTKIDMYEVEELQWKLSELEVQRDLERKRNQERMSLIEGQLAAMQRIFTPQEVSILQQRVGDGTIQKLEEKELLQPLKDVVVENLPDVLRNQYDPKRPAVVRCGVRRGGEVVMVAWNHGSGKASQVEIEQVINSLNNSGLEVRTVKEETLN